MSRPRVLVIGHGLAGALLAGALEDGGADVLVVDRPDPRAASTAAAGIVSPITGRRHVPVHGGAALVEAARGVWRELERRAGASWLAPLPIRVLFADAADRAAFVARAEEEPTASFVAGFEPPGDAVAGAGAVRVQGGFRVDVPAFLAAARARRLGNGTLLEAEVEPAELVVGPQGTTWRGASFRAAVLCGGWRSVDWPGIGRLGFRRSRGELIELASAPLPFAGLTRRGRWLLDLDGAGALAGSTFDWTDLDAGATAAGRRDLLAAAQALGAREARVTGQRAGVRAGTNDSLPYLGAPPGASGPLLFTGFGSKGVLTAPPLARVLAKHVLEGAPLPPDVDAGRRLRFLR